MYTPVTLFATVVYCTRFPTLIKFVQGNVDRLTGNQKPQGN